MTETTTTRAMKKNFKEQSECGASLVEYALLVSLIAAVSLVAITEIGQQIANNFCANAGRIDGQDQGFGATYKPDRGCCAIDTSATDLGSGPCV